MKVFLLADVKKVGRKHELCDVADGYAQNVLLPKKLAVPATPDNLKRFKKEESLATDKKAYNDALLAKSIKDLNGKVVSIEVRANDSGTLFQTIHKKQVVEAIEKVSGARVPENAIIMRDIKQKGDHEVTIEAAGARATLTLSVQ